MMYKYVFLSFASLHTGKALGAAVVESEGTGDYEIMKNANEKAKQLGIMPNECNQARGYGVPDTQGLELNKFYSTDEMDKLGFGRG